MGELLMKADGGLNAWKKLRIKSGRKVLH